MQNIPSHGRTTLRKIRIFENSENFGKLLAMEQFGRKVVSAGDQTFTLQYVQIRTALFHFSTSL
jgi:hypothetical protein